MQQGKNKWVTNRRFNMKKRISDQENKLDVKEKEILELQNEKLILQEKVNEMESEKQDTKCNRKTYAPIMRMMVYDAIVAQVPTYNIPDLIAKISLRCGVTLTDVPKEICL